MMILEPKKHTAKKPAVYYTVYGWPDKAQYASVKDCYEYAGEAIARCKYLINTGFCVSANVRENIVYRRTAGGELSTSGVIFSI